MIGSLAKQQERVLNELPWIHCTQCTKQNPNGCGVDAWYNLTGNAGTSSGLNFTYSGNAGYFVGVNFEEFLPPPGTTATFEAAATAAPSSCCVTSTGPPVNASGTDLVFENRGGNAQVQWNSCTDILDYNGGCFRLNATSTVQIIHPDPSLHCLFVHESVVSERMPLLYVQLVEDKPSRRLAIDRGGR